jgi:hypothetical protein
MLFGAAFKYFNNILNSEIFDFIKPPVLSFLLIYWKSEWYDKAICCSGVLQVKSQQREAYQQTTEQTQEEQKIREKSNLRKTGEFVVEYTLRGLSVAQYFIL